MKKILSIVLTLCMVMSLIPAVIFAADVATFTAIDGTGGTGKEGYTKLFDVNNSGTNATKWCVQNFSANDTYVVIEASEVVTLTNYTFITGNDTGTYPGRNPKAWELYGSNNYDTSSKSGDWTPIHTVTDGAMPETSFAEKTFDVTGASGYKYYKLHITSIDGRNGANLFQLTAMSFTYVIGDATSKWAGWTKITQAGIESYESSGKYIIPAGKYYLDEDITSGKTIELSTNNAVILDLNGHTLKNSADYNGDFIRDGDFTDSTTSFTLTDTSTSRTGKIAYSGTGYSLRVGKGASMVANGGIIEGQVHIFSNGSSISNTDPSNVTHFKGGLMFGNQGYTVSGGIFYGNYNVVEYGMSSSARKITFMDGETIYAMQVMGGVSAEPIAPVKEGYSLVGWLDGNTPYTFGGSVDHDKTLTARWFEGEGWIKLTNESLKNYSEIGWLGSVSYRLPSGKYFLGEDIVADNQVCVQPKYGANVSINVTLDLDGHTLGAAPEFSGVLLSLSNYADTNTHTLTIQDSSAEKNGKIVHREEYFALDLGQYTVLYANGGTVIGRTDVNAEDCVIVNTDHSSTTHFKGELGGEPNYNTVGGGVFYGGFDNAEKGKDSAAHTVTFMDGDTKYAVQVLNDTAVTQLPYVPERTGCSLDGWYNGDDEFEFGSPITEDIVLTAKWFDRGEGFIKLTAKTLENYAVISSFDGTIRYVLPTGKYYLGEDITIASDSDGIEIGADYLGCCHVTLDLNGHTLEADKEGSLIDLNGKTEDDASGLTLIDGSEGKTGKIVNKNSSGYTLNTFYEGNTIYANGGTVEGSVSIESGSFIKNTDPESVTVFKGIVAGYATIEGGIFEGLSGGFNAVNGGTFKGDVIEVNKVNGGTFHGSATRIKDVNGGTFYGTVEVYFTIYGGIFYDSITFNSFYGGKYADTAHKITFTDGGEPWAVEVLDGTAVSYEPDRPTKTDWTFEGWYDGDDEFVFGSAITEDLTLTAKWKCAGHVDEDVKDHKCDVCGETIDSCKDTDKDHVCDRCGAPVGTHEDRDFNHVCDYGCKVAIGDCEDEDKDHKCDYGCGKDFGTHEDRDFNHVCDYGCKVAIGDCVDTDKNHKCDYGCGKDFGTHEDRDFNHVCDYGCKVAIGDCVDTDKDHKCDYGCGKDFGTHEDRDFNHVCDYGCKAAIGDCVDLDKDHKCDYGCGKDFGTHEDKDLNHVCDYGCKVAIGNCVDTDKDHKCDYGCGKDFGTHEDKNHDHVCDYGCKAAIGDCEDTDKDHKCDYGCGKNFGTHEDRDFNHVCDYGCKVTIGDCVDTDKDHKCDYGCGKDFGTHEDADKDHKCDYCGESMTECGDTDPKDHKCDLCGAVLSVCGGGKATCKRRAVCGHCGAEYGDIDASCHEALKHVDAKAATETEEGNTEYWHCDDCGKYFSDKDGKTEITLSDTVIAKTEPAHQTGDILFFLVALMFVSGGAFVGTAIYGKKRRYSAK